MKASNHIQTGINTRHDLLKPVELDQALFGFGILVLRKIVIRGLSLQTESLGGTVKFLKIIILVCTSAMMIGCSFLPSASRGISSANVCESTKYPPLFNVIENSEKQIVVELGDFTRVLDLSDSDFSFEVFLKDSTAYDQKKPEDIRGISVLKGDGGNLQNKKIVVPVTKTGVYEFYLFPKGFSFFKSKPFWQQKVFSVAKTEQRLTDVQKKELAEKYAPILSYHDQELYSPVSIEYLTNQADVDEDLAEEPFRLSLLGFSKAKMNLAMKLKDLIQVLPYYGHSESVLKSGLENSSDSRLVSRYGKGFETIYYSVFENVKWNEVYINYHFFYSYDPKNGTPGNPVMAAHIFDRESITVVLHAGHADRVIYGAHLSSQNMRQLGDDGRWIQKWVGGRVYVNWPEVIKQGDRPVASVALGSHGMYPKKGTYAVFLNDGEIPILKEPAGGGKMLSPEFAGAAGKGTTYKLKRLNLGHVTSACDDPQRLLAYSGSTVDVLGPTNATFPPFTDREEDYNTYGDLNDSFLFDLQKTKRGY